MKAISMLANKLVTLTLLQIILTTTGQFANVSVKQKMENHQHQLNISWELNNSTSAVRLIVTPLVKSETCGLKPCYDLGKSDNNRLIPEFTEYDIENGDCKINSECSYAIKLSTSDEINEYFTNYTVLPDCNTNSCSCPPYPLPNIKLSKIDINTNKLIQIAWKEAPPAILELSGQNITLKSVIVVVRITKHAHLNKWELEPEIIANVTIPYTRTHLISAQKETFHEIPMLKPLVANNTIDITVYIEDINGCTSDNVMQNVTIVPNFSEDSEIIPAPRTNDQLMYVVILLLICTCGLVYITIIVYNRVSKKHVLSLHHNGYNNSSTVLDVTQIPMIDNSMYIYTDIAEAIARGDADEYEVPHYTIHFGSEIGHGAFGQVFRARVDIIGGRQGSQIVAVKQLRHGSTTEELTEFYEEILMMKHVGKHENIVNLLGCCTIKPPMLIIMEYIGCGDLLKYLRQIRSKHEGRSGTTVDTVSSTAYISRPETEQHTRLPSLTETLYTTLGDEDEEQEEPSERLNYTLDHNELKSFAVQIARGMRHLEEKEITHRDLAARNILIDERKTLKISDFGLSRCGVYINRKSKKLPLRWLSIEAICDNLYSSKSDVWAFAVVLWEIGTLGGYPYPGIDNLEILPSLLADYRLQKPENCSKALYDLMLQCWHKDPEIRPSFREVLKNLEPEQQRIYIDFGELDADYVFPPVNTEQN